MQCDLHPEFSPLPIAAILGSAQETEIDVR